MRDVKVEKIKEAVKHVAAEFLVERDEGTSLITVTGMTLSPKGDKATILLTVLPEEKEAEALAFAKRHLVALREHIGRKLSIHHLPFLSFAIDVGEKNRQRIERLSQASK